MKNLKLKNKLIVLICLLPLLGIAQEDIDFSAMFYNVENLFDTFDDSTKDDSQFLPQSERHWTTKRYNDKIIKITKVIVASGRMHSPDLVGLAEIENEKCLQNLALNSPLSRLKYAYIHFESPDVRGIDVVLLYNINTVRYLSKEAIRIDFKNDTTIKTRDILYVKLYSKKLKDTIHTFVNHWPSRWGGKTQSEYKRIQVARVLRAKIDSLIRITPKPNILIMGDMNDYPSDVSIKEVLRADTLRCDTCLYNMNPQNNEGTYKYQGRWNTLDQIIVSGNFRKKYTVSARIINEGFLLLNDPTHMGYKPFRTYQGPIYKGGFSDHLPVIIEFRK